MQRRLVIAGLAAIFAVPVVVIEPAAAAILFTCDSVSGSAVVSPGLVHAASAQSLSSGPTAPRGPADIALASVTAAGVKGNGQSDFPSISVDGTKVAFWSSATNLDAGSDARGGTYVKDLSTGALTLVAPFTGLDLALSPDGTSVAFDSVATDLDPRDTDMSYDVYVKNLATGDLILASTSDAGVKGNGDSGRPWLSADGTRVAFQSSATNLDPADNDPGGDVYVKDLATGDITLASTSDTGVTGNGASSDASLSGDGRRVAFASSATNFDPRATDPSISDVYVKDLGTDDITLASTSDAGVKGNDVSGSNAALSDDGTRVAFESKASNLDPGDADHFTDVYVKDLDTGEVTLASTSDTGVKGNGDTGGGAGVGHLSASGTKVAFETAQNLDPADTLRPDVYVKDVTTGDITLASTSDTGVKGNAATRDPSLSADGARVAFGSQATNLYPADTDSMADVYVKQLPAMPTSIDIGDCSNGQTGTASVVEARSYPSRPLGCPVTLGGAASNDYPDQTPVLLGSSLSLHIDWTTGPDSFGVAKLKMGTTGTQWRAVLAIQASPGHSTPTTNQYLPAAGSGFTKTKLKGRIDWSALDSFNCTSGVDDPLSWLDLVNNGSWIVKNA